MYYGSYATNNYMMSSFGEDPVKARFITSAISPSPTHYLITNFRNNTWTGLTYLSFSGTPLSTFPAGAPLLIGMTEKGRYISKKNFEVDFNLTTLEFSPTSTEGVSAEKPGIIRVYPIDSPESYGSIEVDGFNLQRGSVNIDLKLNQSGKRGFIIDAFDPSLNPNNYGEFSGRLIITGKPIVVNNISRV